MDALLERVYSTTDEQMNQFERHVMVGGGSPGPRLVKGKGVRITDTNGKSYIDCTSQSWAMYLGYANEEITQAVYEQMSYFSHVHQGFHTMPRYHLAAKLASLAPKNLNRVSFTVGGGAAIEAAMKIAMKNNPGAKSFLTLWDAYHGSTLTTAGASWITTKASGQFTGMRNFLDNVNNNFIRIANPYCYRCPFGHHPENCATQCADMLRLTLEKGANGPVAGVIVEPIQASGGQIPLPKAYLQQIRKICDEFGALLIYDEIQTYCRIGEFFAAEHYEVEPDIIVLGKGLGAGFPIAAIIIHDRLKGFEMHAEELHTFANNSVSQIAALKQIDIIERDNLLENTRRMGAYIADRLRELQLRYEEIGDIRQVGLHIGVEMIEDADSKLPLTLEKAVQIRNVGMENGIILGTGGYRKHLLKIKPALIVKQEEADELLNIFEATLRQVLRE
ncbi:aspartate aminotransferase family protein [Cohnella silvisoli]|uniref:Aminotransferase class III-fold pyridoxal phosphate-dependent enzyme n=1 Tax=Cohnella silvisoli TaxID=2873699 RepID=A0ABV1KMT7_9BACL|nr:aminotransferase class III-fold pyridoxal phosphate-dependent enzyme [Cohnella silvisoli]MCD9020262.1 aminotransferase class III-fold pyridoxal phosphate-dependent enzyme [Cohnella silvisoli]